MFKICIKKLTEFVLHRPVCMPCPYGAGNQGLQEELVLCRQEGCSEKIASINYCQMVYEYIRP